LYVRKITQDWFQRLREALKRLVASAKAVVFNAALAAEGAIVFARRASWASKASCRSGQAASIRAAKAATG
jgi:hypothetical protein